MQPDDSFDLEIGEIGDLGDIDVSLDELPARTRVPDPTAGLEATGSLETDSQTEMSETLKAFKERARQEARRFELVTDSEYWVCLCFQSREQKEQFLRGAKLLSQGDKYLDGRLVADKLGIKLNDDVAISKAPRIDPKFAALSEEL